MIVPKIASLAPICVMGQLALGCVELCMNNMTTLVLCDRGNDIDCDCDVDGNVG